MVRIFRRQKKSAVPLEPDPGGESDSEISTFPLDEAVVSVIDVETTGLFSGRHDRVIEIAVVRTKGSGAVVDEFDTLIDPNRDLGPTHIHGITGADIRHAPPFSEVAGEIVDRIRNTVVVGHNIRFDLEFLRAEFGRLDAPLPPVPNLCTFRLGASLFDGLPSRSLAGMCKFFGIPHHERHSALGDARATAALYALFVREAMVCGIRTFGDIGVPQSPSRPSDWPTLAKSGDACPRKEAVAKPLPENQYLSRLIGQLPASSDQNVDDIAYRELLDRVLEDRVVTEEEAEALQEMASSWGLGRNKVIDIHRSYLRGLVSVALEDDIVTEREHYDLGVVAKMLNVELRLLEKMLQNGRPAKSTATLEHGEARVAELGGLSVCFTGETVCSIDGEPITREQAHTLAENLGLEVRRSVTKKLDLLVLADPHSMSGKAKKARQYGIRTMAEEVFWRKIGVKID